MKRVGVGIGALGLVAVLAAPSSVAAQEVFNFSGVWIGEFEERTEPERDMANRGQRDRAISGAGRSQCDGTLMLTFRGANDDLSGAGTIEQTCKGARGATDQHPPEPVQLEDFEFKDKGEGKDKELKFRMHIPNTKTRDGALIRCDAKGKYKPKDMVFEGDFNCRYDSRQRTSGQRTMALQVRGKFELTRGGAETEGGF